MGNEVGPHGPKLVLGNVPGKMRKRSGKPQRLEDLPFLLAYTPEL